MKDGCLIVGSHSEFAEWTGGLLAAGEGDMCNSDVSDRVAIYREPSSLTDSLTKAFASGRLFDTVVFDVPRLDELALMRAGDHEGLCVAIEQHALDFVSALQIAVRRLMAVDRAQIWVLVRDESMRFHLRVSGASVMTHLRTSTVLSVAKEVARFGMRLNAAILHYGATELTADTWREGREGLKSYAQKYKPYRTVDLANYLLTMIRNRDLPVNGTVLRLGCGVVEASA